jgi:hypothetical protein
MQVSGTVHWKPPVEWPRPNKKNVGSSTFLITCRQWESNPQSKQSAFSPAVGIGTPQPLTRRRVPPPHPLVPGGGAHSLVREGAGEFQFLQGDIHLGTLYLCTLWSNPSQETEAKTKNIKLSITGSVCVLDKRTCGREDATGWENLIFVVFPYAFFAKK